MKTTYKIIDIRDNSVITRNLKKSTAKNILVEYQNIELVEDNPSPYLEVVEEKPTDVMFRKDKENGKIYAFFPYEFYDNNPLRIVSYTCEIGYGVVYFDYVGKYTKQANNDEFKELKSLLEDTIGFDLRVITKINNKKFSAKLKQRFEY